ncbi:hypothetical protein COCNU_02G009830 [Cocos nucifera]|uniref:Uncharacterized protein n=1 Tax=Cocos nucifera TaxID=13894 RepID=A0A8K0HZF2_COCNU|nr:hypothetical protein COCNU_02G009830 [Cocos nucifera]
MKVIGGDSAIRLIGVTEMAEFVAPMGSIEVTKAIPATSLLPTEMQVETPQVMPSPLTAVETLRIVVEFLWDHLSFEERQALEGEGKEWDFVNWGEPQEAMLNDPLLDQCLKQDLGVLRSFEIPKLKELLSKQTLFNVDISQVGPEGMGPSLLKPLGPKTLRKRKVETIGMKSACAQIKLLLVLPTFEIEESKPQDIDDFQIVRVQHNLSSSVPKNGQESPVKYLFSEAILSLSAPDVSDLFSKEESTEATGTFKTISGRVQLQASTLEDYDLACKVFSNFLYPANTIKLLFEPLKMKRLKALDCFIQLAHNLNGFMECIVELSTKVSRFKMEAEMLRVARDKLSKTVKEAFARADAIEKKAQDIEVVLKKSAEEKSQLSSMRDALTTKVEELEVRSAKAETFRAEAQIALKIVKEKMAMLRCDMEAQIKVVAAKAVDKFRVLKEYEDEKAEFVVDAYDKRKHFIQSGVAFQYSELILDFLDKAIEVAIAGMAKVQTDLENAS